MYDSIQGKTYLCHPNRFRQVPTFGRFTIRRFHDNVSEMKKLAARDFEDILQVLGLVPSYLPHPSNC